MVVCKAPTLHHSGSMSGSSFAGGAKQSYRIRVTHKESTYRYLARDDAVHRQLHWEFCECATLEGLDFDSDGANTAFQELIFELLEKIFFDKSKREDFLTAKDRVLGSVYSSNTLNLGKCLLWEFLAIDYVFRPEDDIFGISPTCMEQSRLRTS